MDPLFLSDVLLFLRPLLPQIGAVRAGVLNRLEKEFLEAAHGSTLSV